MHHACGSLQPQAGLASRREEAGQLVAGPPVTPEVPGMAAAVRLRLVLLLPQVVALLQGGGRQAQLLQAVQAAGRVQPLGELVQPQAGMHAVQAGRLRPGGLRQPGAGGAPHEAAPGQAAQGAWGPGRQELAGVGPRLQGLVPSPGKGVGAPLGAAAAAQ